MTCNNNFFKSSDIDARDKELIRAYAIGVIMFTLLDEYSKAERMGVIAKIFNKLAKKHDSFHHQLVQLQIGKRKKLSHKCELFVKAKALAEYAWKKTSDEGTDGNVITINSTVSLLHYKNSAKLAQVYGLEQEEFIQLNKSEHPKNTVFPSIKTANALLRHLDERMGFEDERREDGAA